MPRPPILPVPDRKAIFASGIAFAEWVAHPDEPDQGARIRANYDAFAVPADIRAAVAAITRPVHVIAIAETWCGDVILHTPVLIRMAECNPNIQVRFVRREQHPDFFVRFLTNGGEAIPKFVFCSADFVEVGNWGPMSSTPRQWIAQGKACNDVGSARKHVSEFYQRDQHRESMRELLGLMEAAAFAGF